MSLARWRLVVISDFAGRGFDASMERLEQLVVAAHAGSVLVQLRDRTWPALARLEAGKQLRRLTEDTGQGLCINDRLDLAVLLEADAVHLPQQGLSVKAARHFLATVTGGTRPVTIFQAAHEPDAALRSRADGVLLSPAIAPRKGRPALGIESMVEASSRCRSSGLPAIYALGGVDASAARQLVEGGVDGVAIQGALFEPLSPLLRALRIARQ